MPRGMPEQRRIVARFLTKTALTSVTYNAVKEYFDNLDDLRFFAMAVLRVAAQPGTKKYHDDRAFIGSVKDRGFPRTDRAEFDTKLVAAHMKRLLRLVRADLVAAMDYKDVEHSEIQYQGATFHFIALD